MERCRPDPASQYPVFGCRSQFVNEDTLVRVDEAARSGMRIAEVEVAAGVDRRDARSAVLRLLWTGALTTDLSQSLSGRALIGRRCEGSSG